MSGDPKEIFSAGRFIARVKAPYFRTILLGFAPMWVDGLGTIGVTEHGVLLIDGAFLSQVTPEECAGLLIHEVMHVVLEHLKRSQRTLRDPATSNKADDLAINPGILDMGCVLPGGGPGSPPHPLKGLYPEDFGWKRGLTSDEYYELLRQLPPPPPKKGGKSGKQEGRKEQGESGAGGDGEPEEPNDEQGEGGNGGDSDHEQTGDGEKPKCGGGWCGSCANRPMPNEPGAQNAASRPQGELDRMIRQTAEAVREHAARERGQVPAMLQRWADQILAPAEIPWQTELAILTRQACAWRDGAAQHRYDSPSRRQAGIGFGPGRAVLPRFRMPVPNVTVIIDTSGSMGSRELGEAAREVNGILKATGAAVTLCTCDASVTGVSKAKSIQEACSRLVGGGGTDMRPAFEAVMRERPRPEVIICLTDGHVGDGFPTHAPPGTKLLIVLVGHRAPEIECVGAKTVRTKSAEVAPKAPARQYGGR